MEINTPRLFSILLCIALIGFGAYFLLKKNPSPAPQEQTQNQSTPSDNIPVPTPCPVKDGCKG